MSEAITVKLTGRTAAQVKAATEYLSTVLADVSRTSITLSGSPAVLRKRVDEGITEANKADRGSGRALGAVKAALTEALKAGPSTEPVATVKAAATRAAKKAAAAKAAAKAPAPAERPATNSRGVLLDRVGVVEQDGPLAGYEVRLPFAEFETLKRPGDISTGSPWVTRCTKHGTAQPADNAVAAERQGARKVRSVWCPGCRKGGPVVPAAEKRVGGEAAATTRVNRVAKAAPAEAPAKKATPRKAAAKAPAKKATPRKAAAKAPAKKATPRKAATVTDIASK